MTDQDKFVVAMTTCPDAAVARRLADAIVAERLAACVTQIPGVTSSYIWEGELQHDTEILLIIKTTEARFAELEAKVSALHTYELPELIAIPVCAGSVRYLDWLRQTTL